MKELKKDKKELEEKILKFINEFEEEYDCYIYEINLLHECSRNKNKILKAKTVLVKVDFKLCD